MRRVFSIAFGLALLAGFSPAAWAAGPPGRPAMSPPRAAKAMAPVSPSGAHWTTICPGVRHLHLTTPEPLSVHVIVVDLRTPGVTVEVTPWNRRWLKPSQFGRVTAAVAAINGGFWSIFDAKAEGLVMHRGQRWANARDDEFYGFFGIGKDNKAVISPKEQLVRRVDHLREAISGLQTILLGGKVTREAFCPDGCRYRQPRTAVGISADRHIVYLTVVDGRRKHSRGVSLANLARMLRSLGAHTVINLDGGGSAAMYLASRKGLVNQPADRKEREVLNHVGVYWRPTPKQLAAWQARRAARARGGSKSAKPASEDQGTAASLSAPPRPSTAGVPTGFRRVVQRNWREIMSPRNLLVVIPATLGLFFLGLWLVRRRRRD